MASVEQKGLAEDVKSVHRKLREQLLEGGEPNEVMLISITGTCNAFLQRFGRNICKIRRLWTSTAKAWNLWQLFIGNRAARKAGWIGSRIRYYLSILVTCPDISSLVQVESYFWANGEEREKKRDQKRLIRSQDNNREGEVIATGLLDKSPDLLKRTNVEAKSENTPLQVLDVGSCYNPFGEFENWQV